MKENEYTEGIFNETLPDAENVFCSMLHYRQFMMMYESAIKIVTMRLELLKKECETLDIHCPIRSITSRIKEPLSITAKLKKKQKELSVWSVIKNLNDVAGIRVICQYINDIYKIKDILSTDEKIKILKVRDYIKHPKGNGYRSLHLICELEVPFSTGVQNIKCEIQLRTTAMDSWASLEHNMRYKKDVPTNAEINSNLKRCADMLYETDVIMQETARQIGVFDKLH